VRVPSVELGDRYNGRVEGGDLARHYGVEGGDDGCSRDDGVASSVRHGAVPAAPLGWRARAQPNRYPRAYVDAKMLAA